MASNIHYHWFMFCSGWDYVERVGKKNSSSADWKKMILFCLKNLERKKKTRPLPRRWWSPPLQGPCQWRGMRSPPLLVAEATLPPVTIMGGWSPPPSTGEAISRYSTPPPSLFSFSSLLAILPTQNCPHHGGAAIRTRLQWRSFLFFPYFNCFYLLAKRSLISETGVFGSCVSCFCSREHKFVFLTAAKHNRGTAALVFFFFFFFFEVGHDSLPKLQ